MFQHASGKTNQRFIRTIRLLPRNLDWYSQTFNDVLCKLFLRKLNDHQKKCK
ncbi:hypothetical protein O3M35_003752 [Rhynocoris fuscipes]|uniref:Site-specific DNA-methyltransferase (adenine-specific) n=1 Tax=Rhynocoris fuscipes TaxID=488301 RepID=A0AAW1CHJ4_9HEMI